MQPITNSLIAIIRKSSRLVQRDFFELEMLQTSNRGTHEFCSRSYLQIKTLLQEELQKHSKYIYFPGDKLDSPDKAEIVLLVNPLEGIANLAKAIPFFAITVTYLKKINKILMPTNIVINFPALGEIYYAEKGGGAWVERINSNSPSSSARLRASNYSLNLDHTLLTCDNIDAGLKISRNIRCFGSSCYDMSLFISGKADFFYYLALEQILKPGFELMIQESGSSIINNAGQQLIAANFALAEKYKQQFIKNTD